MSSRQPCVAPGPANSRSDAALVIDARAGDDAAFTALVARHARAALAVARAVVADVDLAEDVCQDALFQIWKRLGDCREPEKFASWMSVAVRRHAINALRTRKTVDLSTELVYNAPRPDENAETTEQLNALNAALEQLTPEQRQVVLLFDLEGWSHAEIAASLETTEAMSRQHLMLGRRQLRQMLRQKGISQ